MANQQHLSGVVEFSNIRAVLTNSVEFFENMSKDLSSKPSCGSTLPRKASADSALAGLKCVNEVCRMWSVHMYGV